MRNKFDNNYENDCLCIVRWFFNNQDKMENIELQDIEEGTGIPFQTIHRMLWGKIRVGCIVDTTAGTNAWPLSHIAYRNGYHIRWLGPGNNYIWVSRVRFTRDY